MADSPVVTAKNVSDLEYYLEYLEQRFSEIEEKAKEWATLPAEDKNDFLFDWPVVEDALTTLQAQVRDVGVPEPDDLRYRRLNDRIARDRALLNRLRRS
jgi:hypothetical protein